MSDRSGSTHDVTSRYVAMGEGKSLLVAIAVYIEEIVGDLDRPALCLDDVAILGRLNWEGRRSQSLKPLLIN